MTWAAPSTTITRTLIFWLSYFLFFEFLQILKSLESAAFCFCSSEILKRKLRTFSISGSNRARNFNYYYIRIFPYFLLLSQSWVKLNWKRTSTARIKSKKWDQWRRKVSNYNNTCQVQGKEVTNKVTTNIQRKVKDKKKKLRQAKMIWKMEQTCRYKLNK